MLRPLPMKRLSVVALERDEHAILRGLGRLGAVHLLRNQAGPDTAPLAPPDRSAEILRCDRLASRTEALRRRLGLEGGGQEPYVVRAPDPFAAPLPEVTLDTAEERLHAIETRAEAVMPRLHALDQQWSQVTAMLDQMSAYEDLALPLGSMGESAFLHFAIGHLPEENLKDLQAKVGGNVVLLPLPERGGRRSLVAVTSRKGRFALESALEEVKFRHDALPMEPGKTSRDVGEQCRQEKERLAKDLAAAKESAAAVGRECAQALADLAAQVHMERQILEAEQHFARTEATVLLTGWVPTADLPVVRRRLHEMTGGCCIAEAADPKDVPEEEIPVLLRHSRLLRPFVMLLENYGLPTYREVEPTIFMAVSWVLMFGMMFGDAGNGLVVALGGLALLLKGRTMAVRDAGLLLLLAGLASVGFGIYYGSYFGVTEIGGHELGHDPIKSNPMGLMMAAMALGVGLMSLGLVLNVINRFRRGDVLGGLLDKFGVAGMVFYWGTILLALLLKFGVIRPSWPVGVAFALVIGLPLLGVAMKEPLHYLAARHARHEGGHAQGGLMEPLIESAVEAFDAVLGFLANTVSFIRLAAYAMAHAAVLMASFEIARQIEKIGPAGAVLGILAIVLGNIIAILLEGIVASVQAIRLEYYEFFGKFLSGSGRAFKPFRFAATSQGLLPQE